MNLMNGTSSGYFRKNCPLFGHDGVYVEKKSSIVTM